MEVTSEGELELQANLKFAFTMGIDLSGLLPDTTPQNETDNDSLLDHFFIDDASIEGEVSFAAKNLDLVAQLGFLGIAIRDGTADAKATVKLDLQNPEAGQRGTSGRQGGGAWRSRRLELSELKRFLAEGEEDLVAAAPGARGLPTDATADVSGNVDIHLPVRVQGGFVTLPDNAAIDITWNDITDLETLNVDALGLQPALDFQ